MHIRFLLNPLELNLPNQKITNSNVQQTDEKTQLVAQIPIQNQSDKEPVTQPWTAEETANLLDLVRAEKDWTEISHILNRTYNACKIRFNKVKGENPGVTPVKKKITKKGKGWKAHEIAQLLKLADESREKVDWPTIAFELKRTPRACETKVTRINKIIRKMEEHPESEPLGFRTLDEKIRVIIRTIVQRRLAGNTKTFGWTSQQKSKLLKLADDHVDWNTISDKLKKKVNACKVMYSRLKAKGNGATNKFAEPNDETSEDCESSISDSIDADVQKIAHKTIQKNQPVKTIAKKRRIKWSPQERLKLNELAIKYQNNWKIISTMMKGRTPSACQTQFSCLKNGLRQ